METFSKIGKKLNFDLFWPFSGSKRTQKIWPLGPWFTHTWKYLWYACKLQSGAVIKRSNIIRFCTQHNSCWSRTNIRANNHKGIPYLALTGELWGVYCDDLGKNWPRYNGTALYVPMSHNKRLFEKMAKNLNFDLFWPFWGSKEHNNLNRNAHPGFTYAWEYTPVISRLLGAKIH